MSTARESKTFTPVSHSACTPFAVYLSHVAPRRARCPSSLHPLITRQAFSQSLSPLTSSLREIHGEHGFHGRRPAADSRTGESTTADSRVADREGQRPGRAIVKSRRDEDTATVRHCTGCYEQYCATLRYHHHGRTRRKYSNSYFRDDPRASTHGIDRQTRASDQPHPRRD